MQYYTKQQIQGATRFQPAVLIGNWNEDRQVQECVLQDFVERKEAGNLHIHNFQARMATALAPVELTVKAADGYVHFGDVFQLATADAKAVIAIDTEDKDDREGQRSCTATGTGKNINPCARNTFLLAKYTPEKLDVSTTVYDDDVLHYGQKVHIIAHPSVQKLPVDSSGGPKPLRLFSKQMSTTHYSKYTRQQVAGFTEDCSYDTVFQIVSPDPAHRIASEGVPVLAHVPLCVQHCATSAMLHLTDTSYPNEFAADRELTFHTTRNCGKKALLHHENCGQLTGTIPSKHSDPNFFVFLTGSKVEELPSAQERHEEAAATLMCLRQQLAESSGGLELLSKTLLRMDTTGTGKLMLDEVHLALKYCGLDPTAKQLAVLQTVAGTTQCGQVNYRQILDQLPECS